MGPRSRHLDLLGRPCSARLRWTRLARLLGSGGWDLASRSRRCCHEPVRLQPLPPYLSRQSYSGPQDQTRLMRPGLLLPHCRPQSRRPQYSGPLTPARLSRPNPLPRHRSRELELPSRNGPLTPACPWSVELLLHLRRRAPRHPSEAERLSCNEPLVLTGRASPESLPRRRPAGLERRSSSGPLSPARPQNPDLRSPDLRVWHHSPETWRQSSRGLPTSARLPESQSPLCNGLSTPAHLPRPAPHRLLGRP